MQIARAPVRAVRNRAAGDWAGATISIAIAAAACVVLVTLLRGSRWRESSRPRYRPLRRVWVWQNRGGRLETSA